MGSAIVDTDMDDNGVLIPEWFILHDKDMWWNDIYDPSNMSGPRWLTGPRGTYSIVCFLSFTLVLLVTLIIGTTVMEMTTSGHLNETDIGLNSNDTNNRPIANHNGKGINSSPRPI